MAGERAAIFGRLIEQLSESDIDADSRQEMYNILLEVLEEFEVKGRSEEHTSELQSH